MKNLAKHLCVVSSLSWLAAACDDDPSTPPPADGGIMVDGGIPTLQPANSPCDVDKLCLQVKPAVAGQTPRSGRLVIPWQQQDEDFELPLQIAYDTPFDGTPSASTSH